jgi:hypothetical protein
MDNRLGSNDGRTTGAGLPATTVSASMCRLTTVPAATMAPSPMVTSAKMTA